MFKTMRSPIIGICLCVLTVVIWLLFKPLVQVGGGIYYAFASRNAGQWVLVLSEQLSNDMNFSQWNSLDQEKGALREACSACRLKACSTWSEYFAKQSDAHGHR